MLWEPSPSGENIKDTDHDIIPDPAPQALSAPEPKPGPSGYVPPVATSAPSTSDKRWDFMLREMQWLQAQLESSMACPSTSSLLPPLSTCPETSKDNPWRVADGFFSEDELYHISSTTALKVESLEFYLNREACPNFYSGSLRIRWRGTESLRKWCCCPRGKRRRFWQPWQDLPAFPRYRWAL